MVLYSAVSSPLDRSKRFTLSSPGRPVHSDTVLGFSWKHSSHAAIAQQLFTHISTSVYSQVLIYTAESTEASWSERKCPNFETVTTGIRTRALSIRHSTNWATALHRARCRGWSWLYGLVSKDTTNVRAGLNYGLSQKRWTSADNRDITDFNVCNLYYPLCV